MHSLSEATDGLSCVFHSSKMNIHELFCAFVQTETTGWSRCAHQSTLLIKTASVIVVPPCGSFFFEAIFQTLLSPIKMTRAAYTG